MQHLKEAKERIENHKQSDGFSQPYNTESKLIQISEEEGEGLGISLDKE